MRSPGVIGLGGCSQTAVVGRFTVWPFARNSTAPLWGGRSVERSETLWVGDNRQLSVPHPKPLRFASVFRPPHKGAIATHPRRFDRPTRGRLAYGLVCPLPL